jgi:hypothetical protein
MYIIIKHVRFHPTIKINYIRMNKNCCSKTWCQIYGSLQQIRNCRLLTCIIFTILLFSHNGLYSQKFLTDTIYIDFKGDTILSAGQVCIKGVIDNRDEIPNFVMYRTKKKFLILPVDQEILTIKPVSEAIQNGFRTNDNCSLSYTIHINKLEIEKREGRFSSSTFLVADIPVFKHKSDSSHYLGTLYYDHLYHPLHKKELFPESAQNLLYNWHATFKTDLIRLNTLQDNSDKELPPNLIIAPDDKPLYLQIRTGVFAGRNWYGLQGEIFFSRPEISNRYKTTSGIVRYQNNSDYESISIGRNSEHFTFRKNDNLSLDIDLNILLGFLKWKDVKMHNPTLYQIINAEVSSIQSIILDRKNKQGFTFRAGTIEALAYVYDKKLQFNAGGFLEIGYKF